METVLAAVKVGPKQTEIREFPMPAITDDGGLLQVDVSGVCGADVAIYGAPLQNGPFIMGHEIIGRIAKIGRAAALNWRVKEGDRIAVESYHICGHCESCINGMFNSCPGEQELHNRGASPGSNNLPDYQPSRGGGYSHYLYLWPNLRFHRVPDHVPDRLAALAIPFGNGWQWAYIEGQVGPGKTVLIAGPGQQGLACTLASRRAGADQIIVTGLAIDAKRLDVARQLGADHIIDIESEDLREKVMELTNGRGVDVAIDMAAGSSETILPLIDVLKAQGTLLVVPVKGDTSISMRAIARKRLRIKAIAGHSYRSVELALKTIGSGRYPLENVATHQFGLKEVDTAIRAVARENITDAIHVTVAPWK